MSLDRGQCAYSVSYLASEWECSKSTAFSRLKSFEKLGFIKTQAERNHTLITLCKYDDYQASPNDDRTQNRTEPERAEPERIFAQTPHASRTQAERNHVGATLCKYDDYQASPNDDRTQLDTMSARKPNASRTNKKEDKEDKELKKEDSPPFIPPKPDPSEAPANAVAKTNPRQQAKPARGTRLPSGSLLPDDWRKWAENEGTRDPERTWAKFSDYWAAKPGAAGIKLDWFATWRNWCRNDKDRGGGGSRTGPQQGKRSLFDAFLKISDQLD